MNKFRSLGVAAVFLAGCAVGGASARFVVPPASAQQAATLTKWEYMCMHAEDAEEIQSKLNPAGAQSWEVAGVTMIGNHASIWCLKRPKM
jgi:hypothetical protein